MPRWCRFYGLPPREFWNLTPREHEEMAAYHDEYERWTAEAAGR